MPDLHAAPTTVVLVDGSEVGWHALAVAAQRAAETGGSVVAIAVTPPRLERGHAAHFDPESEQLDSTFADGVLTQALVMCNTARVPAELVRRAGRPAAALAAEANERSAVGIVIGRRPPLDGFALPELADQLTALTTIPVHVVALPERPLPRPAGPAS